MMFVDAPIERCGKRERERQVDTDSETDSNRKRQREQIKKKEITILDRLLQIHIQ